MSGQGKATRADYATALPQTGRQPAALVQRWLPTLMGAVLLALILYYGARALLPAPPGPVRLVVYAFSTQEEVLTGSVFPAFEEAWEADTGRELTVEGVFGPSATLAGQIVLGAPADVALFSNAHHATYLRMGKMIAADTEPQAVGRTPMVILTRPGNPLDLHDFADLARPGVRLLHANPRSSGAGEWALLAEYGSAQLASGDEAGTGQLKAIWDNACLLAPSARATMTLFELGACDAFVTYEQDALLAQERGVALELVIPPRTIIAEPVAILVDHNVTRAEQPAAVAFLRYLLSAEGQAHFARYYQRPISGESAAFAPLQQTFTAQDLGGWARAHRQIVKELWQDEIEPGLHLDAAPQLPRTNGS